MQTLLERHIAYLGERYVETGLEVYVNTWTMFVNCHYGVNHD